MSYTEKGGLSNFFVPLIPLATTDGGVLKEMDIGAASGDHGEYVCIRPCRVHRLQFTLTSEAAGGSSVAPTVIFTKRPTPLSATGEAVVGTLTIPDGTAIGATIYKDVDVDLAVGDSLELSWTVGTGSPTGIGVASLEADERVQVPDDNSEMSASA